MRSDPKATYSFEEVMEQIVNIDDPETLEVLADVISEERAYYCLVDLKSLAWAFNAKRQLFQQA